MSRSGLSALVAFALIAAVFPAEAFAQGYRPGLPVVTVKSIDLVEGSGLPLLVWPMPLYPEEFVRAAIVGEVTAEVTVRPNGRVEDLRIVRSSFPEFEEPTRRALRHWLFAIIPGPKGSPPKGARFRCTVAFELVDE